MYLISVYFDEQTDKKIRSLINHVAEKTGNRFMLDNHVPPHITVAAIETRHEEEAIETLDKIVPKLEKGTLQWVSVGAFFSQVIFLQPVLNEYLHNLLVELSDNLSEVPDTIISPYYQPFSWLPHCTIAKQLSKEQMNEAYQVLQNKFTPFKGQVVKIGIAKTNPHRDIKVWKMENKKYQ